MKWTMPDATRLAIHDNRYFASLYYLFPQVESDRISVGGKSGVVTMAISERNVIYYHPKVLTEWTGIQAATVLWHEISHSFLKHAERLRAMCNTSGIELNAGVAYVANIAQDSKINDMIRDSIKARSLKREFPGQPIYSSTLGVPEDESWEQTFWRLIDGNQKLPQGVVSGSGSDGIAKEWETGEGDGGEEAVAPPQRIVDRIMRHAAREMLDQESRQRGSVPGGLLRAAQEILQPSADPFAELRAVSRLVATSKPGHGNLTYNRESRRCLDPDLRMPSRAWSPPNVLVIIDTSGSMGSRDLGLAVGALRQGLQRLRGKISVVTGDTKGYGKQLVSNERQVKMCGGGGTDMGAIIEEHDDKRFDAIICLTDCETPWPRHPTKAKLIVASTREGKGPEWAKTIHIGQKA